MEEIVIGKRGLFMCRTASLFLLRKLKGSMSGDVRDFNNIGPQAVIKFFSLQGKANDHHHMPSPKTGWPSLNVVIFPLVMRLVLDDPKQ